MTLVKTKRLFLFKKGTLSDARRIKICRVAERSGNSDRKARRRASLSLLSIVGERDGEIYDLFRHGPRANHGVLSVPFRDAAGAGPRLLRFWTSHALVPGDFPQLGNQRHRPRPVRFGLRGPQQERREPDAGLHEADETDMSDPRASTHFGMADRSRMRRLACAIRPMKPKYATFDKGEAGHIQTPHWARRTWPGTDQKREYAVGIQRLAGHNRPLCLEFR
ncbi:MAG: hypothetical protein WCL32_08075 [Planctomycetota bacterium]